MTLYMILNDGTPIYFKSINTIQPTADIYSFTLLINLKLKNKLSHLQSLCR